MDWLNRGIILHHTSVYYTLITIVLVVVPSNGYHNKLTFSVFYYPKFFAAESAI